MIASRRPFPGFRPLNIFGLAAIALLSGAPCALAQFGPDPFFYYYSEIYASQATGLITAYGSTQVGDYNSGDENVDYASATTDITAPGLGGSFATDNCGAGCAEVSITGQVAYLGATYSETCVHEGEIEYAFDFAPFLDVEESYGSYSVPGLPSFSLQSIDATNPHLVQFSYSWSGPEPYSAAFELGGQLGFGSGASNPINFVVDQDQYPAGQNTAQMYAYSYGVSAGGFSCGVTGTVGSVPQAANRLVFDGFSDDPPYIPITVVVGHTGYDQYNAITYCLPPVPGSLTTQILIADGDANTDQVCCGYDNEIGLLAEQHDYLGNMDSLEPVTGYTMPSQSPQYQSRATTYDYPTLWVPSGTSAQICNTGFAWDTPGGLFYTNNLGCLSLSLP